VTAAEMCAKIKKRRERGRKAQRAFEGDTPGVMEPCRVFFQLNPRHDDPRYVNMNDAVYTDRATAWKSWRIV